jgi:hypothetical protein
VKDRPNKILPVVVDASNECRFLGSTTNFETGIHDTLVDEVKSVHPPVDDKHTSHPAVGFRANLEEVIGTWLFDWKQNLFLFGFI